MIILKIAAVAYFIAINAYGAMLLFIQRKEREAVSCDSTSENGERDEKCRNDVENENIGDVANGFDKSQERDEKCTDKAVSALDMPHKSDSGEATKENCEGVIYLSGKCVKSGKYDDTATKNAVANKDSKAKKESKNAAFSSVKEVSDMQLFLTALAGGSLGMFITLIVLRYRLKNMPLVVGLPVLSAVYLAVVVIFAFGISLVQ